MGLERWLSGYEHAEDLSLVPRIYTAVHSHLEVLFQGNRIPLMAPTDTRYTGIVHICVLQGNTHTFKRKVHKSFRNINLFTKNNVLPCRPKTLYSILWILFNLKSSFLLPPPSPSPPLLIFFFLFSFSFVAGRITLFRKENPIDDSGKGGFYLFKFYSHSRFLVHCSSSAWTVKPCILQAVLMSTVPSAFYHLL